MNKADKFNHAFPKLGYWLGLNVSIILVLCSLLKSKLGAK